MRARPRLWAVVLAGALLLLLTLLPEARGSVSIAVTWDGLLRESSGSAVVTPIEAQSAWEGGRIYTYTRVRVDRPIAGDLNAGGEMWVRTMGGIVGKLGQVVEGEAVLVPGQQSLIFVHAAATAGVSEVTARGQGQFPVVVEADGAPRVVRNRAVGVLMSPHVRISSLATRLAADVLHGRHVDDVAGEIAGDWSRAHARP